jgi:hypothetical protein
MISALNELRPHFDSQLPKCNTFIAIIKIIINRIKWNYFNDLVYSIYFYVVLCSFAQTYDFSSRDKIDELSHILAICSIILAIFLPVFFIYLLHDLKLRLNSQKN